MSSSIASLSEFDYLSQKSAYTLLWRLAIARRWITYSEVNCGEELLSGNFIMPHTSNQKLSKLDGWVTIQDPFDCDTGALADLPGYDEE
jgi:hypothetical protein